MTGHRRDLSGRTARRDHHVIADAGFPGKINDDYFLRLIGVQAMNNKIEQLRCGGWGLFLAYGDRFILSFWLSSAF